MFIQIVANNCEEILGAARHIKQGHRFHIIMRFLGMLFQVLGKKEIIIKYAVPSRRKGN